MHQLQLLPFLPHVSRNKFSSPEFKALEREWQQKLKESGFNDAESGPYLKEWDSFYFQARHEPQSFNLHHDYYYLAVHFLNEHEFSSQYEKDIWKMHANGMGYREIAKEIEKTQTHTSHCSERHCDIFCLIQTGESFIVNKDKVGLIIKRLITIMMKNRREKING